MAILASKNFTAAKILPPMRLDLIITGSRDYHLFKSNFGNFVFECEKLN